MPESDRRAAERFTVTADTTCDFTAALSKDLGATRIKNVSTEGIGLVVSGPVEQGAVLAILVNNKPKAFSRTLLVQVVHVTPQAGGTYLVGGTFLAPLTYQELTALVM
jgi:PilZ domain